MSRIGIWLFVVSALLVTREASADRYELAFVSGTRWAGSESVDTLSADDAHGLVGIGGAVRLDGLRPFGLDLYVGLDYLYSDITGTTYQRIDSDLSMHAFRATGRAEHRFGSRLGAFGRLSIGYTTGSLALDDQLSTTARPTRDRAHAASTTLGVGGDLVLLGRDRFRIALRTEFEYDRTSAMHFDAAPEAGDDGVLTIPITAASLGDVDVSGFGLRIGLVGRF